MSRASAAEQRRHRMAAGTILSVATVSTLTAAWLVARHGYTGLDHLRGELEGVARATVHPRHSTVWLRPGEA